MKSFNQPSTRVESAQNNLFKKLVSLTKSKGIKQHQMCLVSGEKITREISQQANIPRFWIKTDNMTLPAGDWQQTLELTEALFAKLDVCGTHKPLLCANLIKVAELSALRTQIPTLYVALSDPTNLGALLRTCAAFNWQQIVLLEEASHPFLPKAIRAASGACFTSSFFKGPSIQDLTDPEIMALDRGGTPLTEGALKNRRQNFKLLLGEEGQGLPTHFPGQRLQIPISHRVESLNGTIAASLVIYQWSQLVSS